LRLLLFNQVSQRAILSYLVKKIRCNSATKSVNHFWHKLWLIIETTL